MKKIRNYAAVMVGLLAMVSCEKEEAVAPLDNPINNTRNSQGVGQAGSMAQFAIVNDYLYTIDNTSLKVFDIADPNTTTLVETVNLGRGIQTIFPRNGYLFIGGETSVQIYDVTNPRFPVQVSELEHSSSCDPVVANDKFAFSTLRGGNFCGGSVNELDIIKIEDIRNPKLVRIRDLANPYGLALSSTDDSTLFVCDGYDGLKVFDLYNLPHPDRPFNTDPLELINQVENYEAIDVLSTQNHELIVLTRQGIYLYDATDRMNLIEKSVIHTN